MHQEMMCSSLHKNCTTHSHTTAVSFCSHCSYRNIIISIHHAHQKTMCTTNIDIPSSVVFLYLSQCNISPSKLYKNCTTNSHKAVRAVLQFLLLLFQIVWLTGIDKKAQCTCLTVRGCTTSDLPTVLFSSTSRYNLLPCYKNCTKHSQTAGQ